MCVFGAGAVGSHLAVRLAAAGNEVAVVARGNQLAAIESGGIVLRSGSSEVRAKVRASAEPARLGPQDVVIAALKAPALGALAASAQPLLGRDTGIVFAQNGIPWWYGQGLSASRPRPPDLAMLDPHGALRRAFGPERVLGAVVESSNAVVAPGVVVNASPQRNALHVAEVDDRPSERVAALRQALREAGLGSDEVPDIRVAIWRKLLRNLAGSTLAVLAGATAREVATSPRLGEIYARLLGEGVAVAQAHGVDVGPVDAGALRRAAPDHKPSLLQDYERGRRMEVEAIVLAPHAFARAAGVATPALDVVAPLVAHLAAARGLGG